MFCILFQYVTDGSCPSLPISRLNWNATSEFEVDIPETEDSDDWKWFKINPNWSSGSVSFSLLFFATHTHSILSVRIEIFSSVQ